MHLIRRIVLLAACLTVAVAGCSQGDSDPGQAAKGARDFGPNRPVAVTATVGMVADLVRNVGGDRVAVTQICGSGVDPHLYKPTRDDVLQLRDADVVFYSGLLLEGKMAEVLNQLKGDRPVVAVAEQLGDAIELQADAESGHSDPHVWMDVSAWSRGVDVVANTLADVDPAGASVYRDRAAAYRSRLEDLHRYGMKSLATIPEESRVLVTSHDAFNYFGRAYGIEVLGVQGISTESEAGLQRINELVNLLVDRKIRSVFIESSVSADNIEALVEGARSKGSEVRIADKELFSDAMGKDGTYEGTYEGMLDHNITVVTRALGGDAPEGGLNGKLAP